MMVEVVGHLEGNPRPSSSVDLEDLACLLVLRAGISRRVSSLVLLLQVVELGLKIPLDLVACCESLGNTLYELEVLTVTLDYLFTSCVRPTALLLHRE